MPNIKSAFKRMVQSRERHARNTTVRTQVKNDRRDLMEAVTAKDKEKAGKAYRAYCSVLDKSAKKGVITKNTAARRKTRAKAMVVSLG